jgi:predicted nucleotide-binding protein
MISDVTTWNPNILYELGLRHASRKGGTILLRNSDTTLPFDLNICPTLTYRLFLEKELGLTTTNYESESRVGESIVPILEKMLHQATFAVLILTGEDETQGAQKRARQNVIHEAGLFQGVLGFNRAVVLKQDNLEDFSNIAGLQFISFDGENIEKTFWELQKVLKREKLIA